MKMRNLLFWVILGFVAVVQSTPLNIGQDEVYREAVTDGYLIDHRFLALLTTKSPKRNTTVQASLQPSSVSKESDVIEGSGDPDDKPMTSMLPQDGAKHYATTMWSVSHTQSSTVINNTDGSSSDESGSGHEEILPPGPTTNTRMPSMFTTETSTPSSTSTAALITKPPPPRFEEKEGSGSGSGSRSNDTETTKTQSKTFAPLDDPEPVKVDGPDKVTPPDIGKTTPGWIIIVAFVVGVAALIILCVAIATRDKWNRPNPASQLQTKTNQQRELERETFLLKDQPMENGKAGEYIVIPLDELPEKYPSH